ncbi:MAG: hypothetical protein AB4058_21290 [Microcystaceae cyanobacterium]
MTKSSASSGHKLGQLVGDWFEEYFVFPLLQKVGQELELFVDSRFVKRTVRTGKIIWYDIDGNAVDYDAVLELRGSATKRGVPVAFIECFWRRGSRHSKDKARDDSGKLLPMKETYPTARFLGIISGGDFTKPARELVKTRGIDLFYIPKTKIVQAFQDCGLIIDYPDKMPEGEKAKLVENFELLFSDLKKIEVRDKLHELVGTTVINGYVDRVRATLSSLPQEIRFILRNNSQPICFKSVSTASNFLENPTFKMDSPIKTYVYEVSYSDGSEFIKEVSTLNELRELHEEIESLERHISQILNS